MDAVALTTLMKNRKLSPVEVVEAALARIDQLDAQLHAFCTLTPDIARAEARRVEADLIARA
jgi:Asp-tRNA(Asn)/Glu-tRNA(Gln) amidotransferase A subunit family amidase